MPNVWTLIKSDLIKATVSQRSVDFLSQCVHSFKRKTTFDAFRNAFKAIDSLDSNTRLQSIGCYISVNIQTLFSRLTCCLSNLFRQKLWPKDLPFLGILIKLSVCEFALQLSDKSMHAFIYLVLKVINYLYIQCIQ